MSPFMDWVVDRTSALYCMRVDSQTTPLWSASLLAAPAWSLTTTWCSKVSSRKPRSILKKNGPLSLIIRYRLFDLILWCPVKLIPQSVLFTQMRISYHSICANFLSFQTHSSQQKMDVRMVLIVPLLDWSEQPQVRANETHWWHFKKPFLNSSPILWV